MSSPAGAVCPTCRAAIAPGSSFCTRCGAAVGVVEIAQALGTGQQWGGPRRRDRRGGGQGGQPAPAGPPTGDAQLAAQQFGGALSGGPQYGAAVAVAALPGAVSPGSMPIVLPHHPALGPAFDGVLPARVGRRLAAYAVDLVAVAAAGGAVTVLAGPVYGALAGLELALGFVVWEARSGRTLGNAVLGLRSAKEEAPFAPGLGRAVGRALVLGASHLTGVGQWLVVASGAFDGSGRGQAWHDRAAGTLVVDTRALRAAERRAADADRPAPVPEPVVSVAAPLAAVPVPQAPLPTTSYPAIAAPAPAPQQPLAPTYPPVAAPMPQASLPPAPLPPTPLPPTPYPPVAAPAPQPPLAPTAYPPAPVPAPGSGAVVPALPPSAPLPPAPLPPTPYPPVAAPPAPATHAEPRTPAVSPAVSPAPTPAPAPAPRPRRAAYYVLKVDNGQVFTVTGGGLMGRRPQPSPDDTHDHLLEIEDPGRSLSRTHARFGIDAGGFWVEDRGSANGTSVQTDAGWSACTPGRRVPVAPGSSLRLGDRTIVVEAAD